MVTCSYRNGLWLNHVINIDNTDNQGCHLIIQFKFNNLNGIFNHKLYNRI